MTDILTPNELDATEARHKLARKDSVKWCAMGECCSTCDSLLDIPPLIRSERAQAARIVDGGNVIDALRAINRRLGNHVPKDICGGCGVPKVEHDDQCQPDPEW